MRGHGEQEYNSPQVFSKCTSFPRTSGCKKTYNSHFDAEKNFQMRQSGRVIWYEESLCEASILLLSIFIT